MTRVVKTREEVRAFLDRFRSLLDPRVLWSRPWATLPQIAELGLSIEDVIEIIERLNEHNYSYGPEPDRDGGPNEVWFFGGEGDVQYYIKLTIDGDRVRCLSFHKADRPIVYAFR